MANSNVAWGGAINALQTAPTNITEERALWLEVYAGYVLEFFNNETAMNGLHRTVKLTSGKEFQFPVLSKGVAKYHTPGTELTGDVRNTAKRLIKADRTLVSDIFIDDLDSILGHFDYAMEYARESAKAIALKYDTNVIFEYIKGARASAVVPEAYGGSNITSDDFKSANQATRAAALAAAIYEGVKTLKRHNVPLDGVYAMLDTFDYYDIVENKEAINQDWGGSGSYADGTVFKIAGIPIYHTNQIIREDTTNVASDYYDEFHGVDMTKTTGFIAHRDAVGSLDIIDLSTQLVAQPEKQGDLIIARKASGHGVLRPEAIVELKLDTLTY